MTNIPYGKQTITEEDIDRVVETLKGNLITQGDKVPEFEETISKRVNVKYAIAVNSATSALHIACMAVGLNENDWLWTSSTSFVASANCGLYCGAKIDFIDISMKTGLIDPDKLKEKLSIAEKYNKLPKAIVVVHLAGTSCEMKTIRDYSNKYQIKIIEDASHAIGGQYENQPVGSCKYSDITIFSFHPVKIITTGEGGMATTNDPAYARKMNLLRSHGIEKEKKNFIEEKHEIWKYEQQLLGMNYRMTDIQATLGISQAGRLDKIIEDRNKIYIRYQIEMTKKNLPIKILDIPINTRSALHLCIIQLLEFNTKDHRDLFVFLRNNNIGVQVHYSPIHLQPYYKKLGFKEGDFPNSEMYERTSMSIPIYPGLTINEQERVMETISQFFKNK